MSRTIVNMMRGNLICVVFFTLLAGLARTLLAGDLHKDGKYDFYGLARYPEGGKLVEGVDLYEVKEGDGPAEEYTRRVVDWWPRKGVDVIEVQDGMILREWTLRRGPLDPAGGEDVGKRWPLRAPLLFKAHLIGFRGIGNTMSSKFSGDGGPLEPAVVLRLADGRKRCFPRGSFSEADKKYIMDLYVKEMKRIKAGLDKTKRAKPPRVDIEFPDNAKPGEPGTMQVESEHFIWGSGSQAGSDDDPWVNAISPDKAQWYRDGSVECAEYWWTLNEYAGQRMPYWDRPKQFKYFIKVPGTKRDGYQVIGGYAGGGYGACEIKGAGGGPWSMGLFHEWGHGTICNGWRVGGGEAQADTHQCLADPGVLKGNPHVRRPWLNIFNGGMGYGRTMFYTFVGEDPNWGYNWFACLPSGVEENSVMQIAARIGEQRGLFKNGIRGFGDMMGEYGTRLATFDCEREDLLRRAYFAPTRNWLEAVDLDKRIYRIPLTEAPEPFGVNIVRLVPDGGADEIVVDFTGLHDPDLYSDWRACIIAVGGDGIRRYSPMWNKGRMTLLRRTGDLSYWLTVAATPAAIYNGSAVGHVYNGRHAYHYPWSVRLTGARPGTPRQCRADFNDADLLYKTSDSVPAPADTTVGKRYLKNLKEFQASLVKLQARGSDADRIGKLKQKVQSEINRMVKGARHANGGGWVQSTAKVAPTAYVGPNAMVLDNAQVLDNAIVEDYAIVSGTAVVSEHARLSGQAVVKDEAKVTGYSRTWRSVGGTTVATVVPLRGEAKELNKFGLLANYAMDSHHNTILEDRYRFEGGAYDGYLYGRPGLVTDGKHKGLRFNGKSQYAELCPRVADLGQITVDIALKWQGKGAQTIFDFGSDKDNCLVLRTAGKGRPKLLATVDGKAVITVAGKKPLPQNKWVRLRVEIDGKRTSLWIAGERVAETSTSFRPCDVFPAGGVKRNFVAAARGGSSGFRGLMDYVVIYHTVHEDFSKVPPPILDSPTRPTADFIASLEEKYGDLAVINEKVSALSAKMLAPYKELIAKCESRRQELLKRDPGYVKAVADVAAAKAAHASRKREATDKFNMLPENAKTQAKLDKLRSKNDDLRRKVQALEQKWFDRDEELARLQAQYNKTDPKLRALKDKLKKKINDRKTALRAELESSKPVVRKQEKVEQEYQNLRSEFKHERDLYVVKEAAEAKRKVDEAKGALKKATKKAEEPYAPEMAWLQGFSHQSTSGYYNSPYRWYINRRAKAIFGGGEKRDDLKVLRTVMKAYSSEDHWHTSVDWDWRMQAEADGSIRNLPLMQKWLERVRGPVVTKKPNEIK